MADLKASGFNCRNCGAPVTQRGLAWTQTIVCPSCGALQDPHDPNVLVLQEAQKRIRIEPRIPLGTRGTLAGHLFEVIGFQYRTITVEGTQYGWSEYLLFNPYRGFRYLTEYDGHWNVIRTLQALPLMTRGGRHGSAEYDGVRFRHFQSAAATTAFVVGEFPWRVRTGDVVQTSDYVAPPRLLSAERTADETTWSVGQYATGRQIWDWFGLPGSPPPARGVFENQPSPYTGQVGRLWRTFLLLLGLLALLFLGRELTADRQPAFSQSYTFAPGGGEQSFVTDPFALDRGPSNVRVDVDTDLSNNWLYVELALIDSDHGTAYDFGKEVSYYFGRDSDGAWSEGRPHGSVTVPDVPAGRYYLRVEPQGDTNSHVPVRYTLTVVRDVPTAWPYLVALGLLAVPPIWMTVRSAQFESTRWAEGG
jgi:hypothetical protein